MQKLIDSELLSYELELEYDDELLDMYIPLMSENIREEEMHLFRHIDRIVYLSVGDMGGASLRGSIEDAVKLLERLGYSPQIVLGYLLDFESRVLSGYYEERNKEK